MNDDAFYDEVAKEMQENRMIPGVWTRAFAEADGDENRAKAIYIKRRVAQLAENSKQQHEEAKRLMPAGGGQEKTSPPLVETTTTSASRPPVVRGLCVIGFFGTVCGIEMVFSESARNIGVWYPPYLAFSLLVGFVCMVGFWRMRRWAFFTYTGLFALNQIAMLVAGTWSVFGSVIPGVFISIMFSQLSKMR